MLINFIFYCCEVSHCSHFLWLSFYSSFCPYKYSSKMYSVDIVIVCKTMQYICKIPSFRNHIHYHNFAVAQASIKCHASCACRKVCDQCEAKTATNVNDFVRFVRYLQFSYSNKKSCGKCILAFASRFLWVCVCVSVFSMAFLLLLAKHTHNSSLWRNRWNGQKCTGHWICLKENRKIFYCFFTCVWIVSNLHYFS